MGGSGDVSDDADRGSRDEVGERLVYVMPAAPAPRDDMGGIGLLELCRLVWRRKWMITSIAAVFCLTSIVYALTATEWYKAEVLLAPTDDSSAQSMASQFGGLASLAGITIGSEGTAEPIAVLRSRDLAREFIVDLGLMPVLFADDWDESAGRWISDDPEEQPDLRDGVKFFRENMLSVSEDTQTGLVTLGLEWKDPDTAADWAGQLVERLNDRMRRRALQEAESNVAYLQAELEDVGVVAIQQSIGRLLETELQKLMLAKGNLEFSFKVIDPAEPPKYRSRPKRTLLVIMSTVLGGMVGLFVVLVMRLWQREQHAAQVDDKS